MDLSIIYKYNKHLLFFLAVGDLFFSEGKKHLLNEAENCNYLRARALHTRPHGSAHPGPLLNNMPAIKSSKACSVEH